MIHAKGSFRGAIALCKMPHGYSVGLDMGWVPSTIQVWQTRSPSRLRLSCLLYPKLYQRLT
jgi:hypothetical protein